MLQIMQDNNYASSFSSKHKQNMAIFRKIENKMIESGYHYKNYLQIGVRWKNLKNLYTKAKRSNSKNEQQLFPFYDEMDCLMSGLLKQASSEDYVSEPEESDTVLMGESTPEKRCNATDKTPSQTDTEASPVKRKREASEAMTTGMSPVSRKAELNSYDVPAHVHSKPDRNGKLNATLAMSKQELSDEFYRSQKRLIDYEFSLYVRKEEELIDRMQQSTRAMLEEGMDKFFTRLKEVLAGHQTVQHEEVIETYE